MKRFHVNVSVADINEGIRFYSALFAGPPTVQKSDYAKWMLEDPRINFAIAQRGQVPGVNHVGFQVDSPEELTAMRGQLTAADNSIIEQADASCCYAKSNKYWVTDPAGVAWETFHTLDSIPIYGQDTDLAPKDKVSSCCVPEKSETSAVCCAPKAADESCCAD